MLKQMSKLRWVLPAVVAFFGALLLMSTYITDGILLQNAQIMGSEIVRRFSADEENYVIRYEMVLKGAQEGLLPENRPADLTAWMQDYLYHVERTIGIRNLGLYASVDGKITAATYWEGGETFDPTGSIWYQQAMAVDVEVVYTDAYTDIRLEEMVVTIATRIPGTDDVVALDIYPSQMNLWRTSEELPEGSRYYLSDGEGVLLYYAQDGTELPAEDVQQSYDELFAQMQQGIHDVADSSFQGPDNEKLGVYFHEMGNGWYSVITIPYATLLGETQKIQLLYWVVIVLFGLLTAVFLVRDFQSSRSTRLYNEIVRVLGNSYYALYLVDLRQGQYAMLKSSDLIRRRIDAEGPYEDFMGVLADIIEPDAYGEFQESFSLSNMQKLVRERVRDYGGDFKRLFNGEYRWVHVQMLYDESLQKDRIVLCFKDVNTTKEHELRQAELLKQSLTSMQQMAEARNLFFSSMSHDMRTPLNAIIGLSTLAEEHCAEPEKLMDYLRKINLSSRQLLDLINDILEISKMEQGKLQLNNQQFQLRQNLEDLVSLFEIQAVQSGKTFTPRLEIGECAVVGDWFRIQQILQNLLSNAFKFTGSPGRIDFTVREVSSAGSRYRKFQFVISDDGVGMTEEFLEKIFVPFERETRFGAANVAGTGLGMPIVHDLVLQMEGEIEINSKLGEGSTFVVTLPLRADEEDAQPAVEKLSDDAESKPDDQKPETWEVLTGKKVLLAEDNEINMEIATELLEMRGASVTQAWNGWEALELFRESPEGTFQVILMDMQMPEMDGCQAARAIRNLDRADARTVPIIAVTANAFSEDIAHTREAGMDAHIAKPIDFQVLESTLRQLLG